MLTAASNPARQESVWDYPRPPSLVPDERRIVVEFGGVTIADTTRAVRVLETSHPPTFYLPLDDVRRDLLRLADGASFCEWKGAAAYVDVVVGRPSHGRPGGTTPSRAPVTTRSVITWPSTRAGSTAAPSTASR